MSDTVAKIGASPAQAIPICAGFGTCGAAVVTLELTQRGASLAHVHFSVDVAEALWRQLGDAIVKAREPQSP